jgi:hypothetical protein
MLNKREEKGCKRKEDVVEINVQCVESLKVHGNNEGPTKETWGAIKKKIEITEQKNEVEATSLNKKDKIQKEVKDLTLIFIVPLLKIYLYYEE